MLLFFSSLFLLRKNQALIRILPTRSMGSEQIQKNHFGFDLRYHAKQPPAEWCQQQ